MMQQRSLSTNIPVVDHDRPSPMNLSVLVNTTINKLIPLSVSFTRTASKKRREFGKDKRHASVNVDSLPINIDEQRPKIHQVEFKQKELFFAFFFISVRLMKQILNPHHYCKFVALIFVVRNRMHRKMQLNKGLMVNSENVSLS